MGAAPADPGSGYRRCNTDEAQYRKRTICRGRFDHAHEAYVFTTDAGAPVYHVLTPFIID